MDKWNRHRIFVVPLILALALPLLSFPAAAGETAAANASDPAATTTATNITGSTTSAPPADLAREAATRFSDEALRSYLHLQEQLHAARLAIEQARSAASVEAQTNLGAVMSRMEAMETELANQRAAQIQSAHQSNRILMFAAAGIFVAGILAVVLTVILQTRGMNRLAEIATGLSAARGLSVPGEALALGGGERLLLGASSGAPNRLQSTISQLEGRIREIEVTAESPPENGDLHAGSRAAVLARAQALMNLGQDEPALEALNEAIARTPGDATLYLRKGMALERLKRSDAALESYERAISLDENCTQAYLAKGGILNQQERYQEALACFEQALANRAQGSGLRQARS